MTEFSNPDKLEKDADRVKQNGCPRLRAAAVIKKDKCKHQQEHGKIDHWNKETFFIPGENSQAQRCCKGDTAQTKADIAEDDQKHQKHYFLITQKL